MNYERDWNRIGLWGDADVWTYAGDKRRNTFRRDGYF